jgi:hypothetical protein
MKKLVQCVLLLLIAATGAWAQNGQYMQQIHAAKMVYLSDRMHLTQDQSLRFVPLYNEYEQEIRTTRQRYRLNAPDDGNDAKAREVIDDNLDYQQDVIGIKRKYNDQFLKIISPTQLADMYKAEREFKQLLMKRLEQRRNGGGRGMGGGRRGYN